MSALETAQEFWRLLIPFGLQGGALAYAPLTTDDDNDTDMDHAVDEEGWKPEYTDWWFEFLQQKGGKGVSKDTWIMVNTKSRLLITFKHKCRGQFLEFVRTIDSKFQKYDETGQYGYGFN